MQIEKQIVLPEETGDELSLMQRCATGDAQAAHEILRRVHPRVKKTVRYLSKDQFENEDIEQNTLVRILQSAGQFRGECSLNYWTDRVTVYTASKIFEKQSRRNRITEQFWIPPDEQDATDDKADLHKMKAALTRQLAEMKPEHRMVLVLHYAHGYKIDEIATLTQTKKNTVRGRLRVALKKIRQKVQDDPLLRSWIRQAGVQ